jgi:hypothetical protein
MKKSICMIILLVCTLLPVICQNSESQLYERKIKNYNRMKNAGWTMTGMGAGFATAGAVMLIKLPDNFWSDENTVENQSEELGDVFQAIGGCIFLGVGIGLLAGGLTLGNIGTHKAKLYKRKIDNLSVGMICTPNRQGISLVYRF